MTASYSSPWPGENQTCQTKVWNRSQNLALSKPEISQALDSLLEEICSNEEAKVMHTAASQLTEQNTRQICTG